MALIRTFLPGQYRSNFLGSVGPFQVTVTIASVANGGFANANAVAVAGSAPALASLLVTSDIILALIPAVPAAGVALDATITANGTLNIQIFNSSGGAYTGASGGLVVTVFALRLKTA